MSASTAPLAAPASIFIAVSFTCAVTLEDAEFRAFLAFRGCFAAFFATDFFFAAEFLVAMVVDADFLAAALRVVGVVLF